MKKGFVLYLLFFILTQGSGQSYWFGVKTGLAVNWQSWGGQSGSSLDRNQLLSIPIDAFIESYDEEGKGSFYAQLGFRTRGTSYRFLNNFGTANTNLEYKFNNLVLEAGISKTIKSLTGIFIPYYKVGLRGEYTMTTNLDNFATFNNVFYPSNDFVRRFPFGFTVGGGFNYNIEDLYGLLFEFTVNPDIGLQYEQPPLGNVRDPFSGQLVTLELQQIRNLSLEFKLGIRFLRKVEYID
jgi:hypothetical protein